MIRLTIFYCLLTILLCSSALGAGSYKDRGDWGPAGDLILGTDEAEVVWYNGIYAVSIRASGDQAVTYYMTWPTTDGDSNEVMITDGSGALSWSRILPLADGDPGDILQTDGSGTGTWTRPWAYAGRDPSGHDWTEATLTEDGAWHDLDCSSIVPAGTKLIHLRVYVQDDAVYSSIYFRKNGNTNSVAIQGIFTEAVNIARTGNYVVPCDTNRVVEYMASNVVFTDIDLTITGWEGYLAYSATEQVIYAGEDVVYAGEDVVYP